MASELIAVEKGPFWLKIEVVFTSGIIALAIKFIWLVSKLAGRHASMKEKLVYKHKLKNERKNSF